MEAKIICLKVRQQPLGQRDLPPSPYNRFPFDRSYLINKKLMGEISRMFRYFYEMTLDEGLVNALNELRVKNILDIGIRRSDTTTKKDRVNKREGGYGAFNSLVEEYELDTLIVPTRAIAINPSKWQSSRDGEDLTGRKRLAYTFTKAINSGTHPKLHMPPIILHTPNKIIPVLCAACVNILKFYSGECAPGTHNCSGHSLLTVLHEKD